MVVVFFISCFASAASSWGSMLTIALAGSTAIVAFAAGAPPFDSAFLAGSYIRFAVLVASSLGSSSSASSLASFDVLGAASETGRAVFAARVTVASMAAACRTVTCNTPLTPVAPNFAPEIGPNRFEARLVVPRVSYPHRGGRRRPWFRNLAWQQWTVSSFYPYPDTEYRRCSLLCLAFSQCRMAIEIAVVKLLEQTRCWRLHPNRTAIAVRVTCSS